MKTIDLRSDTVTLPGKGMLDAMMSAKVGDDVFEEDPTCIELEQFAAKLFGKENALFCPSGTMTNQIAIRVHTRPGDEVICHKYSHVYNFEGGGIAVNSNSSVRLLEGNRGLFTAEDVLSAINDPGNVHYPLSRLVVIENTCNKGGGSYWDINEIERIASVCKEKNLGLHLDGARLFNALIESGETTLQYGKLFDSISICLSKGLGAPVGSILLGSNEFIKQARRIRKVLGGGMRQVGFLAAAGKYALDNNIERLKDDHIRARQLGTIIESLPYVKSMEPIDTNIIVFNLADDISGKDFINILGENKIRTVAFGPQTIRMVTHMDITDQMIENCTEILTKIVIR